VKRKNRPGKPGGFVLSKVELGRVLVKPNQRAAPGYIALERMADRQSIRQIWLEMKAASDRDGLTFFGGCSMAKSATVGLSYGALRKECLDAVRQWPGCETISGIQILRDATPGGFSVRVTLYGTADKKIADRAISCVQREKRRHFHLND
jgi:hypothetical protein